MRIKDLPPDTSLIGLLVFNFNRNFIGTITEATDTTIKIEWHTFLGNVFGWRFGKKEEFQDLILFGNYLDCVRFDFTKMERVFSGTFKISNINKSNYLSYVCPTILEMKFLINHYL